ncbi:MAG: Uma2 family endonuclease [Cyanobacteria bacterium P01_F01_bin.153]
MSSTTWSREDLQRGLEPDECCYITSEAQVRGKMNIDLTVDPPPDLAIEIDITSSSLNRLEIYASLGIKEVWRFDGESLFIYSFERRSLRSRSTVVLPVLSTEKLLEMLKGRDAWEKTH